MNLNDFTPRADILDGDHIVTKRGTASGAEGLTLWSTIKAAIGSGITVVAFPANSAASGAIGQIACNADVLGVYVGQGGSGGVNWVFMHIHQRA